MILTRAALGCIILFNSLAVFGQAAPKVVVAGKTLDNNAVKAIQAVQPGFSLYGDSASIAAGVLKYYTFNKFLAAKAKKEGLDTTKQMREQITFAKQALEEKFLADAYSERLLGNIAVSDQEGMAYYKQNLQQFSIPGRRDFFFVQVNDTSAKTLAEVKKFVAEKKADPGKGETKVSNERYYVTFSNYHTNNKDVPYYAEVMAAKMHTWIGPFKGHGTPGHLYYYVLDGVEETFTPYETVKEVCLQNVRSYKVNALMEQWNTEAQKMYPVKVTDANELFVPGK